MPNHQVLVRTLGAAQSGKTAVTHALLRKFNPSELSRREGVIQSHYFTFRTELQQYYLHDSDAGHVAKSLANSTSGFDGTIDGAILVVSAVNGVTPEARHHVQLAQFFGVHTIIPFMSKCDLNANLQSRRKRASDISELLRAHDFMAFDVFPMGACGGGTTDTCEAPIKLLAQMMDRYLRSRYDRKRPSP